MEPKKYITLEDLRKHNKRGDLWISVQGKVYDVSDWTRDHPGGELPLINFSGQDVTDAFVAYHPGTAWKHIDRFFTGYYLQDHTVSELSKEYRRLLSEFTKMGLFEQKGHLVFASLCFVAVMFFVAVCGVLFSDSTVVHLLSAGLVGFLWIQNGWLGHDSGHHQVMTTRRSNRFIQFLTGNCFAGISIEWWKRNHNAHHIACNSLEFDPDLQHMPLFAVSSKLFNSLVSFFYERKMTFDSVARFLISHQHWTFYPVMCFARINLFAQSFIFLLSKRKVPHRRLEFLGLLVFWTWYPLLISCLPNWGERLMFFVVSFSVTGIQHVQFCLNHFASNVYVGRPSGNDWFEKQTNGTLNITCSSWMDWFHGGLQFQVEHHLFPRLPRCQLRRISPIVRELCEKHNLPYASVSFWKANVLTVQTLYDAAFQARNLANPIPKNLIWEAVNSQG